MTLAVRRTTVLIGVFVAFSGCKIQLQPQPRSGPEPAPSPAAAPLETRVAEPTDEPAEPAGESVAEPAAEAGLPLPELSPPPGPQGQPTGPPIVVAEPPAGWSWTDEARAAASAVAVDRVRAWLTATHRAAVLVSLPENYAWLTAGASNEIAADAPPAVLAVLPDRLLVVAPSDTIQAARRPLRALGILGRTYRWDLGRDPAAPVTVIRSVVGSGLIASDVHRPGTERVADELEPLRLRLTEQHQVALRALGSRVARVTAEVLGQATAATTERALAEQLIERLLEAGLEPRDVRVTALSRLPDDGLSTADERAIEGGAAVHVTAAAGGLLVTVGRTVTPTPWPTAVDAYVTARRVYAAVLSAIRPDAGLRDIHAAAERAAGQAGLARNFSLYPAGGVGAFRVAAQPFSPAATARLTARQAVTITIRTPGAYLADTFLVGGERVEILTASPAWPSPPGYVNNRLVPIPSLRGAERDVADAERRLTESRARRRAFGFLESMLAGALDEAVKRLPRPVPQPTEGTPVEPEPPAEAEAEPPQPTEGTPVEPEPEPPAEAEAEPPEDTATRPSEEPAAEPATGELTDAPTAEPSTDVLTDAPAVEDAVPAEAAPSDETGEGASE